MFGFKKKKGKEYGTTVGNYHSGDKKIEAMKDECYSYIKQGEAAGIFMGEQYFEKAYDVAREWVKVENSNRSWECLAGTAFKLGAMRMDIEKLNEAKDAYEMLVSYSSDYKDRLEAVKSTLSSLENAREEIRKLAKKKN